MGLGSFGGGIAAANFLARHGASVLVSDQKSATELAASVEQLDPRVELCLGGHDWSHFEDADLVVLNPAVPLRNEFVQRLLTTGHWLTSEIELFCQLNRGKVVAVTGSNGKSTTTSFIYSMLQSAGTKSWLGGNIGLSLLDSLAAITTDDWVVLELSSFQLHGLQRIGFRPDIAVVTNLAANHLDWHETESHYFESKRAIVDQQTPQDWCVLNARDERLAGWRPASQIVSFGKPLGSNFVELDDGRLTLKIADDSQSFAVELDDRFPGEHNRLNLQAAIAGAHLVGLSAAQIQASIADLQPLEFRLERVAEINGVLFINDGKSTTPESAIAALYALDRPIVLLAGGSDKGVDLSEFTRAIAARTKAAALMGTVANQLAVGISRFSSSLPMVQLDSFAESFRWAVEQARPGDVVLLSAGCASFGWFANYKDRGRQFSQLVLELAEPQP